MLYPIESLGVRDELAAKLRARGWPTVFDLECGSPFLLKLRDFSADEMAEIDEALALRGRRFVPLCEDHPDVGNTLSCRATRAFLVDALGMSERSAGGAKLWMKAPNIMSRSELLQAVEPKDRRAAEALFNAMVQVRAFG
jgi:hypothetical protein